MSLVAPQLQPAEIVMTETSSGDSHLIASVQDTQFRAVDSAAEGTAPDDCRIRCTNKRLHGCANCHHTNLVQLRVEHAVRHELALLGLVGRHDYQ